MKKSLPTRLLFLITLAFPLVFTSLGAQAPASHGEKQVVWTTEYNQALAKSKQEGKPVLLFFTGSDWCGWCTQLKREVLDTISFAELAKDRYIFVELDFPKKKALPSQTLEQNRSLAKKYQISSYPTIVVVDFDGVALGQTGYKSGGAEKYAALIDSIVAPHLAKFKPAAEHKVAVRGEPESFEFAVATTVEASAPVPSQVAVSEETIAVEAVSAIADESAAQDEGVIAIVAPESAEEKVAVEAEVQPY